MMDLGEDIINRQFGGSSEEWLKMELEYKRKVRRRKTSADRMQREERYRWYRQLFRAVAVVKKISYRLLALNFLSTIIVYTNCGTLRVNLISDFNLFFKSFLCEDNMYKIMLNDLNDHFYFENILHSGISLLRILMVQTSISEWWASLWVSHIFPDVKARGGAQWAVVSGCQKDSEIFTNEKLDMLSSYK